MNIFRNTSCTEDFPDLDFPGNYPSDENFSGDRPLIIFDSACNAFNFVCLSQMEPEILGIGKFTHPPSNIPERPQYRIKAYLGQFFPELAVNWEWKVSFFPSWMQVDVVRVLVEAGSDSSVVNDRGQTVLETIKSLNTKVTNEIVSLIHCKYARWDIHTQVTDILIYNILIYILIII